VHARMPILPLALFLLLPAALSPTPAAAGDAGFGPIVDTYVRTPGQGALFVGKCRLRAETAALLWGAGRAEGLLVLADTDGGAVVNVASVTVTDAGYAIGETNGGVYTMNLMHDLANALAKGPFVLLHTRGFQAVRDLPATVDCPVRE
jgi:hypothetical protein